MLSGSVGRTNATSATTPSSTGTIARLAAIAQSSSETARRSATGPPRGQVDVEAEREERGVDEQRRHPEADEGEGDAGERQHREVAGDRDRELARRQHDPRDGNPAEQRLTVVAELPAGADQTRLAARDAAVMADQA